MWTTWTESAKASLTQALEKTGDVISKAATQAGKSARAPADETVHEDTVVTQHNTPNSNNNNNNNNDFLLHLQTGWSNVIQTTKASIKTAQEVVEEQQWRIQERLNEARAAFYKRDPKLPLDVLALKDAQVVYLTDRLISMSHPAMASTTNGDITGQRKLAAVGHLLQRRHEGRFMVWNVSEVDYETRILDDQVLVFSFPGSPSPPLGLLLKLLISMEAWLKADNRNVAVVHCLTGKGRTSLILAAFLCWMGEADFGDIYHALEYIAACKKISTDELVIPSQRRYASYFKNMLDGVRPSQPPLLLKRIIMSEAPRFARGPPRPDGQGTTEEALMGCAPYLQIFKAGKLLFTAPASLHFQQSKEELPFVQVADGSVSFNIELIVQGDILVRCRHLTSKKTRVSMFRAAIHTGYVPPKVLRLKKSELDGASSDERYPDDFFLDLIFDTVHAEEASKHLRGEMEMESQSAGDDSVSPATTTTTIATDSTATTTTDAPAIMQVGNSEAAQALAGGGTTITASTYDSMLHRDSRFWDVIAARRQAQAEGKAIIDDQERDHTWGATIGRRRTFDKLAETQRQLHQQTANLQSPPTMVKQRSALETFSIGGELDFLPGHDTSVKSGNDKDDRPQKKDSLMEALMGALGEEEDDKQHEVEVIIFEEDSSHNPRTSSNRADSADNNIKMVETGGGKISDDDANDSICRSTTGSEFARGNVPDHSTGFDSAGSDIADVEALLADANMNLEGDVDALLKQSGVELDENLLNVDDDDDDDLEDLENFLSKG